jgi:hypothetical protein
MIPSPRADGAVSYLELRRGADDVRFRANRTWPDVLERLLMTDPVEKGLENIDES